MKSTADGSRGKNQIAPGAVDFIIAHNPIPVKNCKKVASKTKAGILANKY